MQLEAGNPHEMLRMTGEGEGKQPIGRWSLKPWAGEGCDKKCKDKTLGANQHLGVGPQRDCRGGEPVTTEIPEARGVNFNKRQMTMYKGHRIRTENWLKAEICCI